MSVISPWDVELPPVRTHGGRANDRELSAHACSAGTSGHAAALACAGRAVNCSTSESPADSAPASGSRLRGQSRAAAATPYLRSSACGL